MLAVSRLRLRVTHEGGVGWGWRRTLTLSWLASQKGDENTNWIRWVGSEKGLANKNQLGIRDPLGRVVGSDSVGIHPGGDSVETGPDLGPGPVMSRFLRRSTMHAGHDSVLVSGSMIASFQHQEDWVGCRARAWRGALSRTRPNPVGLGGGVVVSGGAIRFR